MEIPTWEEISKQTSANNPLEQFIFIYSGSSDFNKDLQRLVDWVILEQRDKTCPECGKVFSHYTGCSLGVELPRSGGKK